MTLLNDWIDSTITVIANKLSQQAQDNPSGFDFGYSLGYKQALLDLEKQLERMTDVYPTKCEHEYKKTLAKSGMYFISMCHKCRDSKPFVPDICRDINKKCKIVDMAVSRENRHGEVVKSTAEHTNDQDT